MTRIVVDPVTRIEGHLRIDVEVDGGRVRDSWSSGQIPHTVRTTKPMIPSVIAVVKPGA